MPHEGSKPGAAFLFFSNMSNYFISRRSGENGIYFGVSEYKVRFRVSGVRNDRPEH